MSQPPSAPLAAPANEILNAQWETCPIADVEALALRIFGKAGVAKRLSSERDETFKLTTAHGNFTLKIANPVEDMLALAFQDNVLLHLAKAPLDVPVPTLVPTLAGEASYALPVPGGHRVVRMLTYLEGEQMGANAASQMQCAHLGRALGSLSAGLAGATARPPEGKLLWDLSHFADLGSLVGFVDATRQPMVGKVLDDFEALVLPVMGHLRQQVIHNDFNPYNILVDTASGEITGIIDFGDMVFGPLVADLAIAASYHLWSEDWTAKLGAMLRGFSALRTLQPAEIDVLPTLIAARLSMTVIITEWRAELRPAERDYILRNHRSAWRGLNRLSEIAAADLRQIINDNCRD